MSTKKVWDEILTHLRALDPKVKSIPCHDQSSADNTLAFVPTDSISYFTTAFDKKKVPGYDVMVVTDQDHRYFLKLDIGDIEVALGDNPAFLRTGDFYLVNLAKIRGSRVGRARDLRFEGSDTWIKNAVSFDGKVTKFLTRFTERFLGSV